MPGIPLAAQRKLLAAFSTPEEALASSRTSIAALVGEPAASALERGPAPSLLDDTLRWLEVPGHHLLPKASPAYPPLLAEIHDPPLVLYAQGRAELLQRPCIAVVGSRNATPQGLRDARAFALALSEAGLCIVSGLALGVDAAAHEGGLAGPSSSIAVVANGPDVIYPPRNRDLTGRLASQGCVVGEFALGMASLRENFPRRNRLISGLARGVLVVEAAERSGSLITAHSATDQGRDVFAIPGSIHSPLAKGCHKLIQEGAMLVECVDDVLHALGLEARCDPAPQPGASVQHPLLLAMGRAPVSIDQIARSTGLAAAAIAAQLCQLEIDGRIAALAGGWFQRIERR